MTPNPYPINCHILTPLGAGVVQGNYDGSMILVRLPITKDTEPHLRDANCLTQHATGSGLWKFEPAQLEAVMR